MNVRNTLTDAEQLERAGVMLHGSEWKNPLAIDLGVKPRNVLRWALAEHPIPPGIWADLRALLRQHSEDAVQLAAELERL